jgi:hypothetical protein
MSFIIITRWILEVFYRAPKAALERAKSHSSQAIQIDPAPLE